MFTSTGKSAELRFTTQAGSKGTAAHLFYRRDSENRFGLEISVIDAELLAANIEQAKADIRTFVAESIAEIYAALHLPE